MHKTVKDSVNRLGCKRNPPVGLQGRMLTKAAAGHL